jgi:hypothetical protein
MKTFLEILVVLAVIGIVIASLACVWQGWKHRSRSTVRLANGLASGVRPDGKLAKLTDAAITTRYLLYKSGSDVDHVAVAGATDQVIGTVDDLAAAAEELVTVHPLGKGDRTKRMVANGAITAFTKVWQAASGKVGATGTRCVGLTLEAASADLDVIEVLDRAALPNLAGMEVVFAGQRTWAGGVATTENFAVTGVLSTDLVLATWNVVAGTITAIKVAPTADTLTITTSANQANGDKYSYIVLRAA